MDSLSTCWPCLLLEHVLNNRSFAASVWKILPSKGLECFNKAESSNIIKQIKVSSVSTPVGFNTHMYWNSLGFTVSTCPTFVPSLPCLSTHSAPRLVAVAWGSGACSAAALILGPKRWLCPTACADSTTNPKPKRLVSCGAAPRTRGCNGFQRPGERYKDTTLSSKSSDDLSGFQFNNIEGGKKILP